MSVKGEVIKLIEELPDTATMEEILHKIYVRARIEEGIKELDEGKGVVHEQAMEQINKWLN